MKKFYLLLFSLILISTSCVYAKTFDDTLGKDCETAVDRISYLEYHKINFFTTNLPLFFKVF